jgi:ribonuclease-3
MLSPRHICAEDGMIVAEAKARIVLIPIRYSADLSQGQWTQAEQALLVNTNLSAVGYGHGLHDCIILNQGTLSVSDKTMATTVEAILGAVFIDGGADALSAVLATLGLTHQFLEAVTSYSCFLYTQISMLLSLR